ncbi:caspase, EACC1-associated type [Nostoc sp.]|uniref:caspase, EACC1-associated type n=1 Tax=Nostoc sp. TaxID=1180 RepID=UPI002FF95A0D
MVKVALLIGVSEYEPGLTPLPATIKDVDAMQQVLQNPEIGGFDRVTPLINLQRQAMEEAIETLFDGRQKDDLVLLFFSGHGIKDESGKLYFATRNTRKNLQGKLIETTAVAASSVHKFMTNSRSKHQVVILDCCFSGAFAEGMAAKDNGFVDIKNQLGGEGRAVLTSSTSTQYSFEQQGADTSTYTRYIVEGLQTGAADRDEDGWISVDELHEYATKAVQEATPAMKPEIYAIKEGYKINIAKAPIDDPKLKYRREVEYWVESGNGEISFTGRAALEGLQEELELTSEEAAAIETKVLAPVEVYKKKLQRYEQAFRNEIKLGFPPSDKTRTNLKRLQQALGLRDEDIALIEAPIIVEQPLIAPPVVFPPSLLQNSNFLQYVGASIIGVIGVFIGGNLVYFFLLPRTSNPPQSIVQTPVNFCANKETYSLNDRISLGEEILLKQDTNPDKEAGVKAFYNSDCSTAIKKFESSRQANRKDRTDPEALIYLNNAKARQQGDRLKIAVSVPIDNNPDLSKEMLRGVAQVQDEVNSSGGINSKLLEVAIANDGNEPDIASNIARQFVKEDNNILAVVGPNATLAFKNAANLYFQSGNDLVMISPTSSDQKLNESRYENVFRTSISSRLVAEQLSNYAIKYARKTNILVCVSYTSTDNTSLKDEFKEVIKKAGGKINPTKCNVSASNLDPSVVISQAIKTGADGLLLTFPIDERKKGLAVAQANKGQLALFSNPGLYTQQILEEGKADVDGMILAVPWRPQAFPGNPFEQNALKLWGGTVNWRTATTYDATLTIVKGLRQTNKRNELQNVLHNPKFSVDGATGKIQFSESGDRKDNPIFLVKVQQKPGTDKYEFVPIQP